MNKADLKKKLRETGIYQYQIAEKIGIREEDFSKKLRHDLSPEYEDKINHAISEIMKEKGISYAEDPSKQI